jgi:transforming growth factor-beta-induced protein
MQARMRFLTLVLAVSSLSWAGATVCQAKDETTAGKMSTASTQDVINTLRKRGAFHRFLDGLDTAYSLDNVLKGKGPYTVFAPTDKAFSRLNQADQDTLFGNPTKLKQVLSYHVLDGEQLNEKALESMKSAKTMEGHDITLSTRKKAGSDKDDLYVDKARVQEADIKCSNGIVHIIDAPIMPQLVQ